MDHIYLSPHAADRLMNDVEAFCGRHGYCYNELFENTGVPLDLRGRIRRGKLINLNHEISIRHEMCLINHADAIERELGILERKAA